MKNAIKMLNEASCLLLNIESHLNDVDDDKILKAADYINQVIHHLIKELKE